MTLSTESLQDELIKFMFLRNSDGTLDVMRCLAFWFGKSNDTDIEINTRFGDHVSKALSGGYNAWKETPRGCLALMILVDQFPRSIFRHTARSFDGDAAARRIVDTSHDWLTTLKPEECLFVPCLIMTHQENVEDQRAGVQFYEKLEGLLPTELRVFRTIFEEHLRIIEICGTFPHRDHYYGRPTSDRGRMIMENPKLRFDLPLIAENGTVKFGHDPRKLWQATQNAFNVLERINDLATEKSRRHSILPGSGLSPKELAECRETFRAFDKDGSGFFGREELAAVLVSTGRPCDASQLQNTIDRVTGIKGAAGITFEQFATTLRVTPKSSLELRLRHEFDLFDTNRSGSISFDELKDCIQSLDDLVTTAEVEEMMKVCDTDGNGSISYEEFLAMVPTFMDCRPEVVEETLQFSSVQWDKKNAVHVQVANVDVMEVS